MRVSGRGILDIGRQGECGRRGEVLTYTRVLVFHTCATTTSCRASDPANLAHSYWLKSEGRSDVGECGHSRDIHPSKAVCAAYLSSKLRRTPKFSSASNSKKCQCATLE